MRIVRWELVTGNLEPGAWSRHRVLSSRELTIQPDVQIKLPVSKFQFQAMTGDRCQTRGSCCVWMRRVRDFQKLATANCRLIPDMVTWCIQRDMCWDRMTRELVTSRMPLACVSHHVTGISQFVWLTSMRQGVRAFTRSYWSSTRSYGPSVKLYEPSARSYPL